MRASAPSSTCSIASFHAQLPELGNRVRIARQAKGMTQADVAIAIGDTSSKTISAIEVGRVEPSVTQLQAIAAVLNEPIGYFTGENASMVEAKMDRVALELREIRRLMEVVQSQDR